MPRPEAVAAQDASVKHAWQRQQHLNLQKLLQKLKQQHGSKDANSKAGSTPPPHAATLHNAATPRALAAALEALSTRVRVLEQERVQISRTLRNAERKADATEAKLQAALSRLGVAHKVLPPPLEEQHAVSAADERTVRAEQHHQRVALEAAQSHKRAAAAARKHRNLPMPSPPPPPAAVGRPAAQGSSSSSGSERQAGQAAEDFAGAQPKVAPPRPVATRPAPPRPKRSHTAKRRAAAAAADASYSVDDTLAAYEPEAIRPARGCGPPDEACAGGYDADVDGVVDCVRCAIERARGQPLQTALASGLRVAQGAEIAWRERALAGGSVAGGAAAPTATTWWLEFGAWSGRSARVIRDAAFAINKTDGVYSFDSFEGLPEDWRSDPLRRPDVTSAFLSRGSFSRKGQPPYHEAGVHWQIGWFNVTLGPFLRRIPTRRVSFVHIDCDLYSSTASVFNLLASRLTSDAVVVFDELLNYPEYRQHEVRAFIELLQRTGRSYSVLGAGPRYVVRSPTALQRLLATKRGKLPFGGTSNEDVAVQLLPTLSGGGAGGRLM